MASVKRAQSVFLAHGLGHPLGTLSLTYSIMLGLNIFLLPPLSKVSSNSFEYFYISSEINTNNFKIGIKY